MSAKTDARDDQGVGSDPIGLSSQGPASLNGEQSTEPSSSVEDTGSRIAEHRYHEAQVFGLYAGTESPTSTEVLQTYQMLKAHRDFILHTSIVLVAIRTIRPRSP